MRRATLLRTLLLATLARASTEAAAQFQYAVKFICGRSPGELLAPGHYFTAINVHNPTTREIGFKKKFVIAPPFEKPGPPAKVFSVGNFAPDRALEIDCPDIMRHLTVEGQETPSFLKGFVVILSGVELDVVAVYTAAGSSGQVETLAIERVPARRQ